MFSQRRIDHPATERLLSTSLMKILSQQRLEPIPKFEDFKAERPEEELPHHINTEHGFIVRIELHGVENSKDYSNLHKYLKEHSFSTVIVDSQGMKYKLPTATYYHSNPNNGLTIKVIYAKAAQGVHAALKDEYRHVKDANDYPTVLVTKTEHIFWSGLKKSLHTDL